MPEPIAVGMHVHLEPCHWRPRLIRYAGTVVGRSYVGALGTMWRGRLDVATPGRLSMQIVEVVAAERWMTSDA